MTALELSQGHLDSSIGLGEIYIIEHDHFTTINATDDLKRTDVGTRYIKEQGGIVQAIQVELARGEECFSLMLTKQCQC